MNFNVFKQAVATQFAKMAKSQLFVTATTGDDLWATYLAAFPEGTNPVYRERTEHDCSCCKQFIRNIGNVVTIQDGKLVSIWDIVPTNSPYDLVAAALSSAVKAHPIANMYRHYERSVGTDKNFEQLVTGHKAWEHFYVTLPATVVMDKRSIPTKLGEYREAHQMLTRAMATISNDAIDTVLELISQNSIYRGAEHKGLVTAFNDMRKKYLAFFGLPKDLFIWSVAASGSSAVTGIRNSVIGTLLVDLSEGVPMERAVASFEAKVAPTNYKRPTALVTKAMIEAAKKTVQVLGLLSALERRYATIDDIKIGDILFASTNARRTLVKDVFDDLSSKVAAKPNLDKVEEVSIDKFLADILPTISHMEVLVENRHMGNLVSLVAPADPTAPSLFKWNNSFSWSYQGDMADSIKERVKAAGGNVTGELCCRLAWDYTDDLDFHMYEPESGHIFYRVRRRKSRHGGMLDVDANGMDGLVENPVENIFYERLSTMRTGKYELWVKNFARRSSGVGFEVEIDLLGQVTRLGYDKVINDKDEIKVATLVKSPTGVEITPHLPSTQSSKSVWGVATHTFVPVTVMMLSPNFWEDTGSGIGNKHYFFMLDGCQNDGSARGFFNEFLKPELDQHRKVIEMVGSRMKTEEEAGRQLSGLGFSSTQRNSITCRITGSFTRNITINF